MAHKYGLNHDYIKTLYELPYWMRFSIMTGDQNHVKSRRFLLVMSSLIGDFIVAVPAIKKFIQTHKSSEIDLLVSPSVESIAKKIREYIMSIWQRPSMHAVQKKIMSENILKNIMIQYSSCA